MPKLVSEIASGAQFQRSATEGRLADSQVRVFRILLNAPGEVVSPQTVCGVRIGDPHPVNSNIYCVSWDAKFEGDSRMVMIATFNYQSTPSSKDEDDKRQPPDIRPANWSTSVSLIEMPVVSWFEVLRNGQPSGSKPTAARNPAGDMYEGLSRFEGIVTINVEQFSPSDCTNHLLYAGCVNKDELTLGSLTMPRGSVMFRGLQTQPHVESYGEQIYRGWKANYEFAYRQNHVKGLYLAGVEYDEDIGWDLAVPQTGFNVKCHLGDADVEKSGMPLKQDDSGKIKDWPAGVSLPDGVVDGQKARAMVLVHAYSNGGASQMPSAQPIPLNNTGSPRDDQADPPVIIRRYRVAKEINFKTTFALRLE